LRIHSDRTYHFAVTADDAWARLARVEDYRSWWPWLRGFEARVLAPGDVWRCTLRPSLPYAIRCDIALREVDRPRRVTAALSGDLSGDARVELWEAAGGTDVRLVSDLAATERTLRIMARLAPPMARWGHDRLLDAAARQFAAAPSPARMRPCRPAAPS
jgi:hypothetical protein